MGDDELLVSTSAGFEAWRLVLVARLILNSAAIALNLLNCLLLRKLCRRRRAHTSILTLLYLSCAELAFAVTSQLFSVLFLASHTGGTDDHSRSNPTEHNKFYVLVALASFGSLKHSSLFVRQWWVMALLVLHCLTKSVRSLAARLAGRRFVRGLYGICLLIGGSFGLARLVAEKIPEYFRKEYIGEEQHDAIHRALYTLEFGIPPLLALPGVAALSVLVVRARRRGHGGGLPAGNGGGGTEVALEDESPAVAAVSRLSGDGGHGLSGASRLVLVVIFLISVCI